MVVTGESEPLQLAKAKVKIAEAEARKAEAEADKAKVKNEQKGSHSLILFALPLCSSFLPCPAVPLDGYY